MGIQKALWAVVVALVILLGATPARAEGCDRQCKIEAADKYLAALVSHDGSDVPLREDAWRQENGGNKLTGGENIRTALSHPIMFVITGMHDLRWYVEGDHLMAVYFLDTVAPTYIFERFAVDDDGQIYEIDAHFFTDNTGHVTGPDSVASDPDERRKGLFEANHGPAGPVPVQEGNVGTAGPQPESSCGPDCVRAAANTFLDAMASGQVPDGLLAAGATQTINHRPIEDIVENLEASAARIDDVAPASRLIQVDGDTATALYEISITGGTKYYGAVRFHTVGGAIHEIEAVCAGAVLCN